MRTIGLMSRCSTIELARLAPSTLVAWEVDRSRVNPAFSSVLHDAPPKPVVPPAGEDPEPQREPDEDEPVERDPDPRNAPVKEPPKPPDRQA
jgi:hypothetical protein